jgi:hypothetical protein
VTSGLHSFLPSIILFFSCSQIPPIVESSKPKPNVQRPPKDSISSSKADPHLRKTAKQLVYSDSNVGTDLRSVGPVISRRNISSESDDGTNDPVGSTGTAKVPTETMPAPQSLATSSTIKFLKPAGVDEPVPTTTVKHSPSREVRNIKRERESSVSEPRELGENKKRKKKTRTGTE